MYLKLTPGLADKRYHSLQRSVITSYSIHYTKLYDLVVLDERGQVAINNINFDVRSGEILGVAGVQGNGQTELVEALTGLRAIHSGQFKLLGSTFGEQVVFRNRNNFV